MAGCLRLLGGDHRTAEDVADDLRPGGGGEERATGCHHVGVAGQYQPLSDEREAVGDTLQPRLKEVHGPGR